MRLIRKLKTCLVSLALISFVTTSMATPGSYAQVEVGDLVPFSGYCFDITASAHIIADKETRDRWCDVKVGRALALQTAKFDLEIGELLAKSDYQKTVNNRTIEALKEENLRLESTALSSPNSYWYVFITTGFLAGAASTLTYLLIAY